MKTSFYNIYLVLFIFLVSFLRSQNGSTAFNLGVHGTYSMQSWSSNSPAGTYPSSMVFRHFSNTNPAITSSITSNVTGSYNLNNGTRINGRGVNGIGFANDGGANSGYIADCLGDAMLSLNTVGRTNIIVSWKAGRVTQMSHVQGIRAQYRIGNSGNYTDLSAVLANCDIKSNNSNSSLLFNVMLPSTCDNKNLIEIRWVYYHVSGTNKPSQMFIDDIQVTSLPIVNLASFPEVCASNVSFPLSGGTPIGGNYSGNGVLNNIFYPFLVGSGSHSIVYSFTDINGFTNSDTAIITVSNAACVPLTKLSNGSCGASNLSLTDFIFCNPISNASDYEYKIIDNTTNFSQTMTRGISYSNMGLSRFNGIQYGKTYQVIVKSKVNGYWGNYGDTCTISTSSWPTSSLINGLCGGSGISTQSIIYCNAVSGAQDYEFTISNSTIGYSKSISRGQSINYVPLSAFPGLIYGNSYEVTIKSKCGGIWSNPGPVCTITINAGIPTTLLSPTDCNSIGLTRNSYIHCVPITGATEYQFLLSDSLNPSISYKNSISDSIQLINFGRLANNKIYDVKVRAKVGGNWGSYSTNCTIQIGSSFKIINPQNDILLQYNEKPEKNISVFPNPINGEMINWKTEFSDNPISKLEYKIIDLEGKVMKEGYFENTFNGEIFFERSKFTKNGLYLLRLTFDEKIEYHRLFLLRE